MGPSLARYKETFSQEDIDGDLLALCTEEVLENDLGKANQHNSCMELCSEIIIIVVIVVELCMWHTHNNIHELFQCHVLTAGIKHKLDRLKLMQVIRGTKSVESIMQGAYVQFEFNSGTKVPQ